jgi:hypothetical protein
MNPLNLKRRVERFKYDSNIRKLFESTLRILFTKIQNTAFFRGRHAGLSVLVHMQKILEIFKNTKQQTPSAGSRETPPPPPKMS